MALLRLDHEDGALAPFGVDPTDDRDQTHTGQPADDGLDFGGIDPFAARFDEVLGAARNGEIALRIDAGEIARIEIALAVDDIGLGLEVALDDARALDIQ